MTLDREQSSIVQTINQEARKIRSPKARSVFLRSAVQTGLVESGLHNLNHGDASSQNWRQELETVYGPAWAKSGGPLNLKASVRRYRQEFEQLYQPGAKSYEMSARIQRPRADLRGRYKDKAKEAEQIVQSLSTRQSAYPRGAASNVQPQVEASYATAGDDPAQRRALELSYLQNRHDPNALLDLAAGLHAKTSSTTTGAQKIRQPSKAQAQIKGKRYNILEEFWNGPGAVNVKNGQRVPKGFAPGHTDHVHVASGPKQIVQLGKLAERMGLHVGENPAFGGGPVTSGHAPNSYHYRNQAIDVSGDPKKEAAYARTVARLRKKKR